MSKPQDHMRRALLVGAIASAGLLDVWGPGQLDGAVACLRLAYEQAGH